MRSANKNLGQRGLKEVLEMPETLVLVSEDCKDSSILSLKIFLLALAPLIDHLVSSTRVFIGSTVVVSSLEDLAETAFSSKNEDSRFRGKGSSKTFCVG